MHDPVILTSRPAFRAFLATSLPACLIKTAAGTPSEQESKLSCFCVPKHELP
jgi:hypothetical protein